MNPRQARVSRLALVLSACVGAGVGLLMQSYRSGVGLAPFSPPLSLPASLLVLAAVIMVLAQKLKKALAEERREPINPFHAIRLLAASRAAQFTGSLFAGLGIGLIMMIIPRITQVALSSWVPMALTIAAAIVLLIAGLFGEHACRIPPEDRDTSESAEGEEGTAPGSVSAYRAHDE